MKYENEIIHGDCREVLKELPDQSIQCCVTSPPYWGLRDYDVEPVVWDGSADCEHEWIEFYCNGQSGGPSQKQDSNVGSRFDISIQLQCSKCSAWRGCLGSEPTPKLYVKHLTDIFREVKRAMCDDGTLWVVLGDSYATHASKRSGQFGKDIKAGYDDIFTKNKPTAKSIGLKEKDLVGIPWMVAFALRDDGWWLRRDIIWNKPNPMPESTKDRPTTAHEYIFLLSKSKHYYYDYEAIKEPAKDWGQRDRSQMRGGTTDPKLKHHGLENGDFAEEGRNKRSVWTVNTQPSSIPHYAKFPKKLIEPCILAGSKENDIVLDPFMGIGTTAKVALKMNRRFVGIDISPKYCEIARKEIKGLLAQQRLPIDE